jgi:hypothetical protein
MTEDQKIAHVSALVPSTLLQDSEPLLVHWYNAIGISKLKQKLLSPITFHFVADEFPKVNKY